MTDPRYTKLARLLAEYSTALKQGDRILLDMIDVPDEFTIEMIRAVRQAGAIPVVETRHTRIGRELLRGTDAKHAQLVRTLELYRMKRMQAYIAIRGSENASENADVAGDRMALYSRVIRPVLNYRVNKTRWCVLRVREPVFRRLHHELPEDGARDGPAGEADEARGPGAHQRPGHGSGVQRQRHRREDVQGRPEHSGRRSFFVPGQELGERSHPVQYADALLGDEV